jgi:hypothetical protein
MDSNSNDEWSDSGDEHDKKKRKRVRTTTVTIACEACRHKVRVIAHQIMVLFWRPDLLPHFFNVSSPLSRVRFHYTFEGGYASPNQELNFHNSHLTCSQPWFSTGRVAWLEFDANALGNSLCSILNATARNPCVQDAPGVELSAFGTQSDGKEEGRKVRKRFWRNRLHGVSEIE